MALRYNWYTQSLSGLTLIFKPHMISQFLEKVRGLFGRDKDLIVVIPQKKQLAEFVCTNHAKMRIQQRIKCSDNKIEKLIIKAWFSNKEKVPESFVYFQRSKGYKNPNIKYRKFLGYMWIFEENSNGQKVLITMFRENTFENSEK